MSEGSEQRIYMGYVRDHFSEQLVFVGLDEKVALQTLQDEVEDFNSTRVGGHSRWFGRQETRQDNKIISKREVYSGKLVSGSR